jgi:citrate synthase
MASVIAACARFRDGKDYVPPRQDISHGANFLYMLRGTIPDPLEGEIMDKCLLLHAEHGFNASTFTARVVSSTLSTCYSSISSAIGSLYGSLHGGANERVVSMIEAIGDKKKVAEWIEKAMNQKQKVMGMGHRVYKVKDPRAHIMEDFLIKLSEFKKDFTYFEILKEIEHTVQMKIQNSGKSIYPNVDFFSGAVYLMLGIPSIFFTPIFAMSRVSGWLAHILEQRADNRIYRPKCLYVGPDREEFIPLNQRKE